MKWLSIILMAFLLNAESFDAKVIRVADGDTITVQDFKNKQIRIRLEGIDCPEIGQPFGNTARQYTASYCMGKTVKIEKVGQDQYGRTLAIVWAGDVNVNKALLKAGLAWHYRGNKDQSLSRLERGAKNARKGLWSDKNPTAPWEWRRTNR